LLILLLFWLRLVHQTKEETNIIMPDLPFQDDLKPIVLLGGLNAAELWPTINIIMITWALLIFAPRWKWTPTLTLIPIFYFAIVYVATLLSLVFFSGSDDGDKAPVDMATFEGVVALFQDPNGVFIGWVHYVAFDPLVGRMIVFDSVERGASTLFHIVAMVPCVVLTLFFGPTGWLLYMILRQAFLPVPKPQKAKAS
jgi:hypothetical protein